MDVERFEQLSPEEQARVFFQSAFKERGDLILHAHQPLELTRSLSHEELYLVIKGMDIEERSEVLKLADVQQLTFVADIDCWKKDRLDPNQFLFWLETLEHCGDEKCFEWLLYSDHEGLVTALKKVLAISKPDREYASDELLGDTPYFTLDDFYYFYVKEENLETVKKAMELLYENHRGRYFSIIEGILGEMDGELEEEAYHLRENRLADRGFPDPVTAHKIYAPISFEEYQNFPRKDKKVGPVASDIPEPRRVLPHYPVIYSAGELFLDRVLKFLREEGSVYEEVQEEMVWIANKIIAADGIDLSSEDNVKNGVLRARCLLSLGLELLSEGDLEKAVRICRERWLETVFRSGISGMIELKKEIQRVAQAYWGSSEKEFIRFLNPPYDLILKAMLEKVPRMHDDSAFAGKGEVRDFREKNDLDRVRKTAGQIRQIHLLLHQEFPSLFRELSLNARESDVESTLFSVLGTVFVRFCVSKAIGREPLNRRELITFMKQAFESGVRGQRRLKPALREQFISKFLPEGDRPLLGPLVTLALDEVEDEFHRLNPKEAPDPRFLSTVFTIRGKSKS